MLFANNNTAKLWWSRDPTVHLLRTISASELKTSWGPTFSDCDITGIAYGNAALSDKCILGSVIYCYNSSSYMFAVDPIVINSNDVTQILIAQDSIDHPLYNDFGPFGSRVYMLAGAGYNGGNSLRFSAIDNNLTMTTMSISGHGSRTYIRGYGANAIGINNCMFIVETIYQHRVTADGVDSYISDTHGGVYTGSSSKWAGTHTYSYIGNRNDIFLKLYDEYNIDYYSIFTTDNVSSGLIDFDTVTTTYHPTHTRHVGLGQYALIDVTSKQRSDVQTLAMTQDGVIVSNDIGSYSKYSKDSNAVVLNNKMYQLYDNTLECTNENLITNTSSIDVSMIKNNAVVYQDSMLTAFNSCLYLLSCKTATSINVSKIEI